MVDLLRRQFVATVPALAGGAAFASACTSDPDDSAYQADAAQIRRRGPVAGPYGLALSEELIRYATLAPSSHNTQCWQFALDPKAITILPDLRRRCPAVDPDDHHLYVSLGCAAENLVHAALAHGLAAELQSGEGRQGLELVLTPTRASITPLFRAIAQRQCTRADYDGRPLGNLELALLARAGSSDRVRVMLLTARTAMDRVRDAVVHANTLQMADAAFLRELRSWIRFNGGEALRQGDGLYSACSGQPSMPTWLGQFAFRWLLRVSSENDRYARQIRSSAGIAVFVGNAANRETWVEVGRCYERFALQATVLGIRNALVNQPVEVASVREAFAATCGVPGERPDLVVRFGRGPTMPVSLRRPVPAVLV